MTLTNITSRLAPLLARAHPNPQRDWTLLLSVATLALALIVGWNIWAFKTVVGGGTLGAPPRAGQAGATQVSIDMIPALLGERASEDARYTDGTYRFADPSL